MKLAKYIIAILFLGYSYTCSAKVYQWVDANGVTQFSQSPPPSKKGQKKIKVKEVKQHLKSKSEIDKNGYVCDILNVEQYTDELFLLGHLRKYLSSFKNRHKEAQANYHSELKKITIYDTSSRDYYKKSAENHKCLVKWIKKKIDKMEPVRLQYIKELEEAKKKLDIVESGHASSNPHYNEYRYNYLELRKKRHGLIQSLEELDGYGF